MADKVKKEHSPYNESDLCVSLNPNLFAISYYKHIFFLQVLSLQRNQITETCDINQPILECLDLNCKYLVKVLKYYCEDLLLAPEHFLLYRSFDKYIGPCSLPTYISLISSLERSWPWFLLVVNYLRHGGIFCFMLFLSASEILCKIIL